MKLIKVDPSLIVDWNYFSNSNIKPCFLYGKFKVNRPLTKNLVILPCLWSSHAK